jgi:hypothetical protein
VYARAEQLRKRRQTQALLCTRTQPGAFTIEGGSAVTLSHHITHSVLAAADDDDL